MLVAPLFATPFLCLLFWTAGGGQGTAQEIKKEGLNTSLPSSTDNQILGKDGAYQKLVEDSLQKIKQAEENYVYSTPDPYSEALQNPAGLNPTAPSSGGYDVNTQVNSTLDDMRRELAQSERSDYSGRGQKSATEEYAEQLRLTQQLLEADPQYKVLMKQLSLGNTKPDSANARVVMGQQEEHYIPVQQSARKKTAVTRLSPVAGDTIIEQRFFSGTRHQSNRSGINTISAVVHNDQTVREGTIIKLRLTSDINLSGLVIPANTFLYGLATLGNERLKVDVSSINYQGSIYPVKLLVYDIDGIPGIRIPGGVDKETRKQAVQQVVTGSTSSIGSVGVTVNNSSSVKQQVAGQVTSSVLEAGKQLLSKKIGEEKVFLKANYTIYLK